MPRRLSENEIEQLLALDVPARLATLDRHGFPRVTPLWFVWSDGAFWMTSLEDRLHLADLARDPRVGICVDAESSEPDLAGARHNRQVTVRGRASCEPDIDGRWTRMITLKYVPGDAGAARAAARAAQPRQVIRVEPQRLVALGDP